jgi:hypothetical protein
MSPSLEKSIATRVWRSLMQDWYTNPKVLPLFSTGEPPPFACVLLVALVRQIVFSCASCPTTSLVSKERHYHYTTSNTMDDIDVAKLPIRVQRAIEQYAIGSKVGFLGANKMQRYDTPECMCCTAPKEPK